MGTTVSGNSRGASGWPDVSPSLRFKELWCLRTSLVGIPGLCQQGRLQAHCDWEEHSMSPSQVSLTPRGPSVLSSDYYYYY